MAASRQLVVQRFEAEGAVAVAGAVAGRLRKIDGWQHLDRYEEIVNRAA